MYAKYIFRNWVMLYILGEFTISRLQVVSPFVELYEIDISAFFIYINANFMWFSVIKSEDSFFYLKTKYIYI